MTTTMNAAVVTDFAEPPHFDTVTTPRPSRPREVAVRMLAAGLHPRVRTGARGAHYTSSGTLPMVPGIDGVGAREDGTLLYFSAADDVTGTMAERAVADLDRAVELPGDADPVAVAAVMNPAMSSWVALRRRRPLGDGEAVLVLGATGNAGAMAVEVARRLGAGRIVAAGRDPDRLAALRDRGADALVSLAGDAETTAAALAAAAAEVDVVVDYLWGAPAALTLTALLGARAERSRALDWIQIGAVAGPELGLRSEWLRGANLRLQGSGQGSVSPAGYRAELPSLVAAITAGEITVRARPVALADVTEAWTAPEIPGERVVLLP